MFIRKHITSRYTDIKEKNSRIQLRLSPYLGTLCAVMHNNYSCLHSILIMNFMCMHVFVLVFMCMHIFV